MNDKQLFDAIQEEIKAGRVIEGQRDGRLTIFKYADSMVIEPFSSWNEVNMQCRGLVFDLKDPDNPVRLTWPLRKFFNLGQYDFVKPENLPDLPFEVFEKVDGSCIQLFIDPDTNQWRACTPGSLNSEQAVYANSLLNRYNLDGFEPNCETPVFELISFWNQNVCNYGNRDELVLLAVFYKYTFGDKIEWSQRVLDIWAKEIGCGRPKRYSWKEVEEIDSLKDAEGYVVLYQNGLRVKVKCLWYLKIHRLLGCVSPKRVLAILRGLDEYGETPESVRAVIPAHILSQFDDVTSQLKNRHQSLLMASATGYENLRKLDLQTRKEQALWIQANVLKEAWGLMFSLLDGKDIEVAAWKIVEKEL